VHAALAAFPLGFVLTIGVVSAGAAGGSTRLLEFGDTHGLDTTVGFDETSGTPPPVGAGQVIGLVIENAIPQLGKPAGTLRPETAGLRLALVQAPHGHHERPPGAQRGRLAQDHECVGWAGRERLRFAV
jgi:hypothetical protein